MRIKGVKNKVTIEMERLVADGMDIQSAKDQARINLGMEVVKRTSSRAVPASPRAIGEDGKVSRKPKVSKKDAVYPREIVGYNSTTKSAWLKSQNSTSRKHAIRAMCLLCVGGSGKEVIACTITSCPLYKFRITG